MKRTKRELDAATDVRYERFAREFVSTGNQTLAAARAGYSADSAASQGNRLLKNAKVKALIAREQQRVRDRHDVSVERVLQELTSLAFVDIGGAFAPDGTILPIQEMPETIRRTISGIEVVEMAKMAEKKEGGRTTFHPQFVKKVKFAGKATHLRMLGEFLEMFKPSSSDSTVRLADRLAEARRRANNGKV